MTKKEFVAELYNIDAVQLAILHSKAVSNHPTTSICVK